MPSFEELCGEEFSLTHTDPVVLELNGLQNQLKEKDRELGLARSEIKILRATEVLKDKALEELGNGLKKMDEKLRVTESLLEQKNLDLKKLSSGKKEALAAQFAAEAALRRLHADQKDDDSVPIESVIAPLEADIKLYKNEIAALLEDKKASERLMKSKESALLEAERILRSALERALIVEEVQNQNFELKRQIEIFQEENKILDKTNRQKVLEVEKLSQTIMELEEAILAGGAAANTIRDFQRQISELNEERKTLERELSRAKVSANRVASVIANEWKDENEKVMPVKLWLEERRLLQAEMQRLREKLAVANRTAKAEANLKDKFKLRLKTLEEGLKQGYSHSVNQNAFWGSPKPRKPSNFFGILSSNGRLMERSTSQPRMPTTCQNSQHVNAEIQMSNASGEMNKLNNLKKNISSGENSLKKSFRPSRSKVVDDGKENTEMSKNICANFDKYNDNETAISEGTKNDNSSTKRFNEESQNMITFSSDDDDMVSGFLFDRLQKEVICLRKCCEAKDSNMNAKDEEMKVLRKKVESLTKAIGLESKKVKREATRDKDATSVKEDDKKNIRNSPSSIRVMKAS